MKDDLKIYQRDGGFISDKILRLKKYSSIFNGRTLSVSQGVALALLNPENKDMQFPDNIIQIIESEIQDSKPSVD